MEATQKEFNFDSILQELENKEQLESLYYLVQNLPKLTSTIRSMEDKLAFVESVMGDKQSLDLFGQEVEEKVNKLHLNQEHFEALLEVLHLLPRLLPLMRKLEEVTLFVNDFLGDSSSVEYAIKGLNDILPLEKGMEIINETNERFKEDKSQTNISLLGIYRLLKDPAIQKGFRYIETFLNVLNKK